MNNDHDILKSLLLKDELELLEQIKSKLLTQESFTREVTKVLATAIKRAQKQDQRFNRALSKPIAEGVSTAFSNNKQSIIDGLLPIMGQLIRKTVTNSIKQFVADINRTLELGFSAKAIKWRLQAYRTGQSFAEIVFQKTIRYQVQELFLINREDGLLIEHVGADETLKDNNAISAMITVLQDFIGDSLKSVDTGLTSIEINNKLFLISAGPKAYLASVIMGSPTERLKQTFEELIENIHAEFSSLIMDQERYQNDDELNEYMQTYLISKSIKENNNKTRWKPWALLLLLTVGYFGYNSYQNQQKFQSMSLKINSIPGLYVKSITQNGSVYEVVGLQDSLADTRSLSDNVHIDSQPFLSMEPEIIAKRIKRVSRHYPGIQVAMNKDVVTVNGYISKQQLDELKPQLNSIMGVDKIKYRVQLDLSQSIDNFMKKHPLFLTDYRYDNKQQQIKISGTSTYLQAQQFASEFLLAFPEMGIQDTEVIIVDATYTITEYINDTHINLPQWDKGGRIEIERLDQVIHNFKLLKARNSKQKIVIVGRSDCQGNTSDQFSQQRAQRIKEQFIIKGINEHSLAIKINRCLDYNKPLMHSLKNVTFKIE